LGLVCGSTYFEPSDGNETLIIRRRDGRPFGSHFVSALEQRCLAVIDRLRRACANWEMLTGETVRHVTL
jgi:hypothetical protein